MSARYFVITVTSRVVSVTADDENDAIRKAKSGYPMTVEDESEYAPRVVFADEPRGPSGLSRNDSVPVIGF